MDNNIYKKKSGLILWFTGLSGSGKTTIAEKLSTHLEESNISAQIIDGDQIRTTHHRYLGFSERDIKKNNELIVNICVKERKIYDVVIVPIISPYRQSRREARIKLQPRFKEIYLSANIACVRERDVKGLYAKSDSGTIANMIGVSSSNPYQPPESPDLIIDTENENIQQSVEKLYPFTMKSLTIDHTDLRTN